MKKLSYLFLMLLGLAVVVSSCNDDDETPAVPTITISSSSSAAAPGTEITLTVSGTAAGGVQSVTLQVNGDAVSDFTTVTTGTSFEGTYTWAIPADAAEGDEYNFVTTVTDNSNQTAQADVTVTAAAKEVVEVTGGSNTLTGDITWTEDKVYLLDGLVYFGGGTLTIEAGTRIEAKSSPTTGDNTTSLIIMRDSKIDAQGTAEKPIVFTSENDTEAAALTSADVGLWAGMIILGRGQVFADGETELGIEGIDDTETRAKYGDAGGNGNNADNSGTLRYVSIRHTGAALSPGNEIQGLTMGAVGSGTTIDYVEVYGSDDDGIEYFGGAVNVKHAVIVGANDDSMDWDLGYRGTGNQYWFAIQRTDDGDHAAEMDGAKPDGATLYSNPTVNNFTYLGSQQTSNLMIFRDATAGSYTDGVVGFSSDKALEVEDLPSSKGVDSYQRMQDGELKLTNVVFTGIGATPVTSLADLVQATDGGDGTEANGGRTAGVVTMLEAGNCTIDNSSAVTREDPSAGSLGAFAEGGNFTDGWTAYSEKGI